MDRITLIDLTTEAETKGIHADTCLEVRVETLYSLWENGVSTKEQAMEFTGLGIDNSGPGRPEYVITHPEPLADLVARLHPH